MKRAGALLSCTCAQRPLLGPKTRSLSHDSALRAAFDDVGLWNSVSKGKQRATTGLFGYHGLHTPQDLRALGERIYRKSEILVRRITRADFDHLSPEAALLQTAKQFDRLSDTMCSVIDMSEAIRQVHPDQNWVKMADEVYDRLCGFMNLLNADVKLYETLKRVAHPFLPIGATTQRNPSLFSAAAIAQQLLLDFEKSGIALPDRERELAVVLNGAIMRLSRRFFRGEQEGTAPFSETLTAAEVEEGLTSLESDEFRRLLRFRLGRVQIGAGSRQAQILYREHPNERIRERMYKLAYPSSSPTIAGLEEMLWSRQRLANLVGFRSYAEIALKDKMAKSPESVMGFLRAVAAANRPFAEAEVKKLSSTKALQLGIAPGGPGSEVQAWDHHYLGERHITVKHSNSPSPDLLSPFFSVGTVVQGLSRLFSSLYGISLQVEEASDEQLWHSSVRKLAVVDEAEGRIGTIYADLFARSGKDPHPAHLTVRCARRVDDDDRERDWAFAQGDLPISEYEVLDMQGLTSPLKPGRHQLPVIVLSCGFQASSGVRPSLMHFDDVVTVFHECGHAIHSMIGRTDFHEVAGTRCATDFVELPSVLMESFATSRDVLSLFARHHQTDAPLPYDQLERLLSAQSAFDKVSDNQQITLAALDQAYHAELPSDFSSTATLHEVEREFSVFPAVPGVAWQARFTHLTSYGASYYSYLFDRAIAGEVWRRTFAADPLSRRAGERYKNEVLQYGNSKDPWQCIGDFFQDDTLAAGGTAAMSMVGNWGVQADNLRT